MFRLCPRRMSHLPDHSAELSPHGLEANIKGSIKLQGLPRAPSLQASHLGSAVCQDAAHKRGLSSSCCNHLWLRTGHNTPCCINTGNASAALEVQETQPCTSRARKGPVLNTRSHASRAGLAPVCHCWRAVGPGAVQELLAGHGFASSPAIGIIYLVVVRLLPHLS